ncbi:hypothetical protein BK141_18085 [Paenibacillus sp. FSL R5-0765]|nr:hypothetical protein BK141_18085 [Paenibacillus sp. FSL R5-0765]
MNHFVIEGNAKMFFWRKGVFSIVSSMNVLDYGMTGADAKLGALGANALFQRCSWLLIRQSLQCDGLHVTLLHIMYHLN